MEATLDIEMAISMAPGLNSVLVYEGPPPLGDEQGPGTNYVQDPGTTAQINDVLNRMATDNLANQLSCSYIMDINTSTVQIFQQFAAQGQSFFQGAGDSGAYPGAVDEPADDPYITIVGGTTLTTSGPAGSWLGESVWLTACFGRPFIRVYSRRGVRWRAEPHLWYSDLSAGHQHDCQSRLHDDAQHAGRCARGQQYSHSVGQRFYRRVVRLHGSRHQPGRSAVGGFHRAGQSTAAAAGTRSALSIPPFTQLEKAPTTIPAFTISRPGTTTRLTAQPGIKQLPVTTCAVAGAQ